MDRDPLLLWRLATHLSVVDAALLIAGHDPSAFEGLRQNSGEGGFDISSFDKPPGFQAALTALTNAIRKRTLKSELFFAQDYPPEDNFGWGFITNQLVLSESDIEALVSGALMSPIEERQPPKGTIYLYREPHWGRTMIDVDDLKTWLRSRGVSTGFFFPSEQAELDDFLNPSHDHFAPELALAVMAWRALAGVNKYKNGVKSAIEAWIRANPDAWQSDLQLSDKAKDRIATLINWRPSGGAPRTGGET